MFTLDQIKTAHAKVKSGADFPKYIQELKGLGLLVYDNYVSDGHTDYFGANDFKLLGVAKYSVLAIADRASVDELKNALRIHQQGQTDYPTFCRQAATAGVEKWTVRLLGMTCTYYDKSGNEMVVEKIPQP